MKFFKEILLILSAICLVSAWDTEQLEIFDLVQDINKNFYEWIGVNQNATNQEIKRAFRTLSIQLHPDKNDAEDANVQFRNLVSVYEVLKDPSKREKYDKVLKEGLPNWKSALFYYRRMRKIGLMEGSLICFMIFTIGQYFFAWAAYLEKKYTADEVLGSKIRKLQKKNKGIDLENIISEHLPKPSVFNTLPFQIPVFIWNIPKMIKNGFHQAKEFKEVAMEKRRIELEELQRQKELEEELQKEKEERKVKKENLRKRKQAQHAPERSEEELKGYSKLQTKNISSGVVRPVQEKSTGTGSGGFWTDEDLVELVRLVKKYPGGTASRWEVIGEQMHRSVNEITFMAAKLKENGYKIPGHSDSVAENIAQDAAAKKEKIKKQNNTLVVAETNWSQEQQAALEAALMKYKKTGNADRWQKIGNCVPDKTKEECLLRYKYLVDVIKQQKAQSESKVEEMAEVEEEVPQANDVDNDEGVVEEVEEEEVQQKGTKKNRRKERRRKRDLSSGEDSDDMYTYE